MPSIIVTLIVLLLPLVCAFAKPATQTTPQVAEIPFDSQVIRGELANGLKYFIREHQRPKDTLELALVVNAGSVLETDRQRGLAHFVEHMAFNGTQAFQKNDIIKFFESIGMRFGTDLNAYTSFDETVYSLTIPTTNPSNVETAFKVLREWASNVTFKLEDIEAERGVVLEELRLSQGSSERLFRQYFPDLLAGSRYAERRPIGTLKNLKNFTAQDLISFYKQWYQPDLMAVIAVGDQDSEQLRSLIEKNFNSIKAPPSPTLRPKYELQVRTRDKVKILFDKEQTITKLQIYYPFKKFEHDGSKEQYLESIKENLFHNMLAQRLTELSRQTNAPFLAATNGNNSVVRNYQGFLASAIVGESGSLAAAQALLRENKRVRQHGFLDSELSRAKRSILEHVKQYHEEQANLPSGTFVEEYTRHFLTGEPSPGITTEYQYYQDLLPKITTETINNYATQMIPDNAGLYFLILAPASEQARIPSAQKLLAVIQEIEHEEVAPYVEQNLDSDITITSPPTGEIVEETQLTTIGVTKLTLSNKTTFYLKPTDFNEDEILLTGWRPGGSSTVEDSDYLNARMLGSVVSELGYGKYSPTDLSKILAGHRVTAKLDLDLYYEQIHASAQVSDLEMMFKLILLFATDPRTDQQLYNRFLARQEQLLANNLKNPNTRFLEAYRTLLYGDHPRNPLPIKAADLKQLNLDRILKIHRDRFSNLNGFNFVIVGNFTVNEIKSLIQKYLSFGAERPTPPGYKDVSLYPRTGKHRQVFRIGHEDKAVARLDFFGKAPFSEDARNLILALAHIITVRATEKLREEHGGVYYAHASGNLEYLPQSRYSLRISIPCAPQRVNELVKLMQAELKDLKDQGPMQSEVDNLKKYLKTTYDRDIAENHFWLSSMKSLLMREQSPERILTFKERLKKITPAALKQAAKVYLDESGLYEVVMLPEVESP